MNLAAGDKRGGSATRGQRLSPSVNNAPSESSKRTAAMLFQALLVQAFHVLTAVACDSLSWSDPNLLLSNPNTTLGSRVFFSCMDGWVLNGSSSTVCQSDGWSDPMPTCTWEGLCPELAWSDFNLRAGDTLGNRSIGSYVMFSCVEGWHLGGHRFTTCQPNGTWDHPQPTCVQNICRSFEISHGNFTVENNSTNDHNTEGTRINILCDEGYGPMYGSATVTCTKGKWLPDTPSCNLMCDALDLGPGVRVNTTDTSPGILVEFSCEDNLILQGNYITRCSFVIGLWVSHPPSCHAATCPPLNLSTGLMSSSSNLTVGTIVTFHCESGWHVSPETTTVCFPDGSWSAPVPACVEGGVTTTSASVPGQGSGLTGAQVGGLVGGLIIGVLLVIAITATITAILTRQLCSKKMEYRLLTQDVSLDPDEESLDPEDKELLEEDT